MAPQVPEGRLKPFLLLFTLIAMPSQAGEIADPPSMNFNAGVQRKVREARQRLEKTRNLDVEDADTLRLKEIQAEIEPLLKKTEADLEKLRLLQGRYLKGERVGPIRKERLKLLEALNSEGKKVNNYTQEFKEIKQRFYMKQVVTAFTDLQTKGSPGAPQSRITDALEIDMFHNSLVDFKKKINESLTDENNAYERTMRAASQKRRLTIFGALLAAAVVVGLIVAFVFGRKPAPGPVTAYPTTPGMLPGPASGSAGAQSGPAGPQGELKAGDIVGQNFRVEREIGRGGMGLVYEATDLTLHRKVAIKQLKAELLQDPKELEMFITEARLVAALKHPNIVEIHSIVRDQGQLNLVFEFVSGKPLHELAGGGDRLPAAKIKDILRQTAAGLDYAHSQKVIHRDLKPANLMLTDQGKVKLMDFGIAHQAQKTVAKLTRVGAFGTPPYMAPEQELGTAAKESDLFSLGVIYYEMLTGDLPFQGPNYLVQKQEMAFKPPSKAAEGIPPEADAVAAKALQADAQKRYHSGAEFFLAVSGVPG